MSLSTCLADALMCFGSIIVGPILSTVRSAIGCNFVNEAFWPTTRGSSIALLTTSWMSPVEPEVERVSEATASTNSLPICPEHALHFNLVLCLVCVHRPCPIFRLGFHNNIMGPHYSAQCPFLQA
ncbi:hypothetical protein BS47DRAFT_926767 [Hydnum rufescens UP504]|uniref:Uncharacterized protein n=1 Tax=Hydnum rufescens UP504 TaxID=1448309 RepID=A0A9P6E1U2_9AGAM|nr:hypothetical protein BS47DRAFT_926767 [Hydnum rufescens UP504]